LAWWSRQPRWNGEEWENAGFLGSPSGCGWAITIVGLLLVIGMFAAAYFYGQSVMHP
jgi:hypothetical protein